MRDNDRYVVNREDGWAVKKAGADRASSVHRTQEEAERAAKDTVANLGGGEVRIQGRDGQWRDSDTVPRGNDPMPPRDRKSQYGVSPINVCQLQRRRPDYAG